MSRGVRHGVSDTGCQTRGVRHGGPDTGCQTLKTSLRVSLINLEEALVWAEKAINEPFRNAAQGRKDFYTLKTCCARWDATGTPTA